MASTQPLDSHAALMDGVYRRQRHIYDLTRKYYLFGRDRLIEGLDCTPGMRVLEIACGTGRNLARIRKRWPGTDLYGLDISEEMLKSARETLDHSAHLALGDARAFDADSLFDETRFDRIILSYSLSMIPGWQYALAQASKLLEGGGSLHIVDFGDLGGIPAPFAAGLRAWLAKFHVEPRDTMSREAGLIARQHGLLHRSRRGPLGYYQLERLTA